MPTINQSRCAERESSGGTIGRRRFLLGGAGAFAVWATPALLDPASVWRPGTPTLDDALGFFDSLALMRGHAPGDARPGWIRKWTWPVTVGLRGRVSAPAVAGVGQALETLSRWTGLPFELAKRDLPRRHRITIDIMTHERMTARYGEPGPVCMTSTWGNGGRLHTGLIEVSENYADCLRHELMHAVGFDNHWHGSGRAAEMPSVLAPRHDRARRPDFTRWDAFAVRLLYHPSLFPGMPRFVALPIARALAGEVLTS